MQAYLGMDEDAARVGVAGGSSFAADTSPLELSSAELAEYTGRFETPVDATILRCGHGPSATRRSAA